MGADLLPDDQLLTRIAAGDAEAFSALFRRRQGDVYRFALHMTGRPAVAEDVTQDTFLAVMRDAGRYDASRAAALAWLCGIARNHVRRRIARERPGLMLEIEDDGVGAGLAVPETVLGELTRAEDVAAVREAVMTLPIRYREAIVLCDLQELSYMDAADALGCALGTVRSRLHRGRALLAAKLAASDRAQVESSCADPGDGEGVMEADADRGEPAPEQSRRPIEFRRPRSARNLA
jgi:RNA polymerase sigma-70 factor (ECF subfamily)